MCTKNNERRMVLAEISTLARIDDGKMLFDTREDLNKGIKIALTR